MCSKEISIKEFINNQINEEINKGSFKHNPLYEDMDEDTLHKHCYEIYGGIIGEKYPNSLIHIID